MMELLIGIPFGIVGALIFIAGYSDRLRDDPLLAPVLAWGVVFPLVWALSILLAQIHPALLMAFPVIVLAALGIRHYRNTQAKRDEPMPLEYYTKLKRQDADKAVVDWNARAEEILIAAGVECACRMETRIFYSREKGHYLDTHRRPTLNCPLHYWRGLELAKSPENLVG